MFESVSLSASSHAYATWLHQEENMQWSSYKVWHSGYIRHVRRVYGGPRASLLALAHDVGIDVQLALATKLMMAYSYESPSELDTPASRWYAPELGVARRNTSGRVPSGVLSGLAHVSFADKLVRHTDAVIAWMSRTGKVYNPREYHVFDETYDGQRVCIVSSVDPARSWVYDVAAARVLDR